MGDAVAGWGAVHRRGAEGAEKVKARIFGEDGGAGDGSRRIETLWRLDARSGDEVDEKAGGAEGRDVGDAGGVGGGAGEGCFFGGAWGGVGVWSAEVRKGLAGRVGVLFFEVGPVGAGAVGGPLLPNPSTSA